MKNKGDKMRIIILFVLLIIPTICFATPGNTRSMRCNNGIVSLGDHFENVRTKCGQPTSWSAGSWVYDFGANTFVYVLYFGHGGFVKAIVNTGNYGNNK
jgi:hypothetical protein